MSSFIDAATRLVLVLSTGALLTGCEDTSSEPVASTAPSTSAFAPPPFPYPPAEFKTDIAIKLDEPLLAAAQFAVHIEIDGLLALGDPEVARKALAEAAPDRADPGWTDTKIGPLPRTGGELHRVTAAEQVPGTDMIEVTVCRYNTPGLYYQDQKNGSLRQDFAKAGPPYTVFRPRVRWTTEPAADGSQPSEPRWLWVARGQERFSVEKQHLTEEACAPFVPDPFPQLEPVPLPPGTR